MMLKRTVLAALSASVHGQNLSSLLSGNTDLSDLAGLIQQQPNLLETLNSARNITLLAPNNAAIKQLLSSPAAASFASDAGLVAAVLRYHVLNGTYPASAISNNPVFVPTLLVNTTYANVTGGQRVQAVTRNNNVTLISGNNAASNVETRNLNFTGGIVHVINKVLTVPPSAGEVLVSAKLTSLYGALNQTNLLNTVNGLRDVTIFAPNNAAFQAIGSVLSDISDDDLSEVLQYHAVQNTRPFYSTDIGSDSTTLPTVNGVNVTVVKRGDSVYVNGAKVIQADVLIAGGVVHVIDNVLNPENTSATSVAFAGATSSSNAPYTSRAPSATTSLDGNNQATATSTSSSTGAAAMPMRTGVVGVAALFGAGAVFANI